jgi:hypothetical protein
LTGRDKQVVKAPFFALAGPRKTKKKKAATVRPQAGSDGDMVKRDRIGATPGLR